MILREGKENRLRMISKEIYVKRDIFPKTDILKHVFLLKWKRTKKLHK